MDALGSLVACGTAVISVGRNRSFRVAVLVPLWCDRFGVRAGSSLKREHLEERFPYLATFLEDAELFWSNGKPGTLKQEQWVQCDPAGNPCSLAVTAVLTAKARLLLVSQCGAEQEEQRTILQWARDRGLAFERLQKYTLAVEVRQRESERVNLAKSEFLAGMSHELRTPLNTILGFSDLLIQGRAGALNARQHEFVSHVKGAADHLLALVNDVLDLARIESGRTEMRAGWFEMDEVLNEVMPGLSAIASQKGVSLVTPDEPHIIYADRLRFKQVIYNLISNALKFTPRDGRVGISADATGGETRITVADTGIGIPAEEQAAIFEKFYQAGAGAALKQGSGLGLAITRGIVEQHGGRVWVESAPGEGSRFIFTLPCPAMPGSADVAACGTSDSLAPARGGLHHAVQVALVEDDPSSRFLMEALLSGQFKVTSYENGATALREIPRAVPEVVVLDISLPDMTGIDVLKALRNRPELRDLPAVAVSAHAMSGDREEFLAAGFDAYFPKPVADPDDLRTTLDALVRKTRTAQARAGTLV